MTPPCFLCRVLFKHEGRCIAASARILHPYVAVDVGVQLLLMEAKSIGITFEDADDGCGNIERIAIARMP